MRTAASHSITSTKKKNRRRRPHPPPLSCLFITLYYTFPERTRAPAHHTPAAPPCASDRRERGAIDNVLKGAHKEPYIIKGNRRIRSRTRRRRGK